MGEQLERDVIQLAIAKLHRIYTHHLLVDMIDRALISTSLNMRLCVCNYSAGGEFLDLEELAGNNRRLAIGNLAFRRS